MALDIIKKRVYDYKERIHIENRDFTVNTLREKWFGKTGTNEHYLAYSG